jgi:hypothetical protein
VTKVRLSKAALRELIDLYQRLHACSLSTGSGVLPRSGELAGRLPFRACLIGIWDESGANYIRAFGAADMATGRPMTPDHFRIGSNTKTSLSA